MIILANKGQSLIEILVALAIFILIISVIFVLVSSSFLNNRQGQETLQALFLAQEGLEAVRSIRDNNWTDFVDGNYGLVIIADQWMLNGIEEDVSSQLNQGKRQIIIVDNGFDRKLITARISWEILPGRGNQVELFTVLTNWRKISSQPGTGTCQGKAVKCQDISEQLLCENQDGCLWSLAYCDGHCQSCPSLLLGLCLDQQGCYLQRVGQNLKCHGQCLSCNNFLQQNLCLNQLGCNWQPGACSGKAISCDNYTEQFVCEGQDGCAWIPD